MPVTSRAVLQKLRRVIGTECQALLNQFNLLAPLVKQMVISEAIADVVISAEQLEEAQLDLLQRHGFEGMEQWTGLLEAQKYVEHDVLERLHHNIRLRRLIRERYRGQAEMHFLKRKDELDQVVYSLLRLKNRFLARELYLQIECGESHFSDLANRFSEGPERNTNGIVGPVSLNQAHPVLVEKLRITQPGSLLEPFQISDWWLVVRLEHYSPVAFTEEVADQMCQEMFDIWVEQETTATLNQLASERSEPGDTSGFIDFSISR